MFEQHTHVAHGLFYPLVDSAFNISEERLKELGLTNEEMLGRALWGRSRGLRAIWTGEWRPPKKGEWFLSGSIVGAYHMPNDSLTSLHIAKIVLVKREEKVVYTILAGA